MTLVQCRRCNHTKDDGTRCGSPALRGHKLCYFHDRQRRTFPYRRPRRTAQFCRRDDFFNVRTADDVMIALNQVMNGVLKGQLSTKEAGAVIFALQTALRFVPVSGAAPFPIGAGVVERPKTVDDVFNMFPGLDDLKAVLTPEDIAHIEGRL